jgi:hypothetical protein
VGKGLRLFLQRLFPILSAVLLNLYSYLVRHFLLYVTLHQLLVYFPESRKVLLQVFIPESLLPKLVSAIFPLQPQDHYLQLQSFQ